MLRGDGAERGCGRADEGAAGARLGGRRGEDVQHEEGGAGEDGVGGVAGVRSVRRASEEGHVPFFHRPG